MVNNTEGKIENRLSQIQELETIHLELGMQLFKVHGGAIYPLDLYAVGALKRSIAQCSGFRQLIEQGNFVCAAALLRLQIDTAARFSAGTLVNNPHEFAMAVLGGERIDKMKDRNGKKMTDSYLISRLAEHFPWVQNVYQETSGYVHLSGKHIFSAVDGQSTKDFKIGFLISAVDHDTPETAYIEAAEAFLEATKIFLDYFRGWIFVKDNPELAAKLRSNR